MTTDGIAMFVAVNDQTEQHESGLYYTMKRLNFFDSPYLRYHGNLNQPPRFVMATTSEHLALISEAKLLIFTN